jgi:hypothetical protein
MFFINVEIVKLVVRASTVTAIARSSFARSRHRSVDRVRRPYFFFCVSIAPFCSFCFYTSVSYFCSVEQRILLTITPSSSLFIILHIFIYNTTFVYLFTTTLLWVICSKWFTQTTHGDTHKLKHEVIRYIV